MVNCVKLCPYDTDDVSNRSNAGKSIAFLLYVSLEFLQLLILWTVARLLAAAMLPTFL